MTKNKNGGGRGAGREPGPIDEELSRQLRFARRRAERGAFPAVTEKSDDELSAKVRKTGVRPPGSFEDKLAAKRAALGLAPVNLDDLAAKQQAEMKAKAERKRPVKPENILPADPEVSIIPEVPIFQEVLEDLENKEQIPVAEKFANQLIEEFALNDELAELLRHHLDKMGDLAAEQKKVFHSILECFKKYVEKDFLPEDWQKRTILSFMLIFVKDHGYKFNDSEINLVTMLRINDLSLDEELSRRHADRQRLEEQSRERDAERLEKLLAESNEPEKPLVKIEESETPSVELPVDSLPLSSPEDILAQAEVAEEEEITPEMILKDEPPAGRATPPPLPKRERAESIFEAKRFSEIIENTMDEPLIMESSFGRFIVGTDQGFDYKDINEDRVVLDVANNFFAVIDGVGGHGNGDVAAQLLAENLLSNPKDEVGIRKAFGDTTDFIKENFSLGKTGKIKKESLPDSCVVACHLEDDILHVYQTGDVRIFVKDKNGKIRFNSFDQGLGFRVSGTVSYVAGGQSDLKIDKVKLLPGDKVFVMTDGVTDNFQEFDFRTLGLSPLEESALWKYLYANGNWNVLVSELGPEYRETYYDLLEGKIIPQLKKVYQQSSESLSVVFASDDVTVDYKKLAKILEGKMQTDGKPDNRSLLVFEYQATKNDVVSGVLEIPPVEILIKEEAGLRKDELTKEENFDDGEKLSGIAPKLAREYQYYAEQVESLQTEVADLEDRNRVINAWTDKQNPDWHNQDDKLKEYGDLCREYTLNIQRLRDLDAKVSRAKVLFTGLQAKAGALLNAQALGLPLADLATRYENEAEDIKAEQKSVKLVLPNGKITEAKIDATEGKSFGGLRVEDKELDDDMTTYVQAQRHFIKGGAKEISPEDNEEIAKVLRLDYLSRHVDYSSILDESGEDELAKRLDRKYFEIQQRIANRYKILLPTRKANIPLYFEGNQARVPVEYLRQLYLYNRKNSPELKNKLDVAKLAEADALAWTEAVLLGQVMRDSTITLTQLSAIKYRLNAILSDHDKLKGMWIPTKDKDLAAKLYPYLKVEKGWFQLLPLEEIKEKMKGKSISGGIFEYHERYFDVNFSVEQSGELKQFEKQEAVKRAFMDKLKEEISGIAGVSDEVKENWLDVLDYQIYEMIKFIDTPDMKSITDLLIVRRDQYILTGKESAEEKQTKISWYQFYDGLVKLADKIS